MPKRYSSQRGFTLVELTIVIVILAILSVYAASRFQGASSFSPYAAQAQAISVIRQIQLARMQSNTTVDDDENPQQYKLQVSETCLGSPAACSGNESLSSKVQVDGQNLVFSIDGFEDTTVIGFDLLGRPLPLVTVGNAKTGTDYTITIKATGNDVESTKICINTEGFVSGGDCPHEQ